MHKFFHRNIRRYISGLLSVLLLMPLFATIKPPVAGAVSSPSEYAQELADRQAEYAKKFDMANLKWSGATSTNGNIDYGNSSRNYLYWQNASFGGIQEKNYIHVYAFEGDTIYFGSNVYNSTLNEAGSGKIGAAEKTALEKQLGTGATIDIVMVDLHGDRTIYDVDKDTGAGYIGDVQTEVLAKTMEDPGNCSGTVGSATYTYKPLSYAVQETGVYTFEFHSYDLSGNSGQAVKNDEDFYSGTRTEDSQGGVVAAWDISVFNEQGQKETGRVYADYLSFQQNGGKTIETYYVVTMDSYIYRWDWNGASPNTYNFFADNKGLTDNATGSTLYKSVKEVQNSRFDYTQFGASYKYPGSANTDQAKSFYLFFEMPNPDLEGYLYSRAIQPDPAENLRFVETVIDPATQHSVKGSYVGTGGYFAFETKEATTATLVLDFSKVGSGGETFKPVTISGPVRPYSTNYFYWDGCDGAGKVIPAGTYNIDDIITLTTKAGEIHFPVHDVEQSAGGFTFTRVSPIYDRDGKQISDLPGQNNILDATKSVIYYDDSAIYYGEHVGRTGLPESQVKFFSSNSPAKKTTDDMGATYYQYANMESSGGEYAARQTAYIKNNVAAAKAGTATYVRVGDHSHVTNQIQYYENGALVSDASAQADIIEYLDSAKHPVGIAKTGERNTYDFGISDFWSFIPAQPVTATGAHEQIKIIDESSFNLTGQVFYDNDNSGDYDSMADSDSLLSDVTLNLYRETSDTVPNAAKTYYYLGSDSSKVNTNDKIGSTHPIVLQLAAGASFEPGVTYYEFCKSGVTNVSGRYFFGNLTYDKASGTRYIYEVIRPDVSYYLTSGQTKPNPLGSGTPKNGSYALYAYDSAGLGTEVQSIKVGGSDGVQPESNLMGASNNTVTAVDVGYHYETYTKLVLKKAWDTGSSSDPIPQSPVFEVSYVDSAKKSHIYEERALAKIENLEYSYELLPATMEGKPVIDWYVSAEYYILNDCLYKHSFEYDASTGTYVSFVGSTSYINGISDPSRIPDTNGDGIQNWNDVSGLSGWQSIGAGGNSAPFNAVLDRNFGTAETIITIKNSTEPGTIEIMKYTGAIEDESYLAGATFRVYTALPGEPDLDIATVQTHIDANTAIDLQWLSSHQIASSTTRSNGRVAFAGLNPDKHYVVREMFAPVGYRMAATLFLVHPLNCGHVIDETVSASSDEPQHTLEFRFDKDDFVQLPIANVPADGDMAVRKRIQGRAWNENDRFTFDIAVRNNEGALLDSAAVTDLDDLSGFFEMDTGENRLYAGNTEKTQLLANLKTFVDTFNRPVADDITVDYSSEFATGVNVMADTKQSKDLVTTYDPEALDDNGQPIAPFDALLNHDNYNGSTGISFPAAGTYTITISENPAGTELTTSRRVFTLEIQVTRVAKPDAGTAGGITLDNSYLSAEVTSIYYQDPTADSGTYPQNYGGKRIYAEVAPTFTNTYTIQPAIQTTGYAITKTFTGRLDESGRPINDGNRVTSGWLSNDKFTVTITGADAATRAALSSSQLYIGGLYGAMGDDGSFTEQKSIQFNQTNVTNPNDTIAGHDGIVDTGHTFNFEEIDFHDLAFPVRWEFAENANGHETGAVVDDQSKIRRTESGDYVYKENLTDEGSPETKVVSKTEDIVYTLRIEESMPDTATADVGYTANGITYDPKVYTMVITLRNAVNADPDNPSVGVNDGIIDELDFALYACAPEALYDSGITPIATCETDQKVVDSFETWANPKFNDDDYTEDPGYDWDIGWYYVNAAQVVRPAAVESTDPATGKPDKFSVSVESSVHPSGTIYIVPGTEAHEDDSNIYSFKAAQDAGLTFIAKREGHSGDHGMTFANTYAATATWMPIVTKTLNGRDWQPDETFGFSITALDWPGKGTDYSAEPVFGSGSRSVSIQPDTDLSGSEGQTYQASLPDITFTCPGVYTFSIEETNDNGGGTDLKYGETYITVTAKDNGAGVLDLEISAEVDEYDPVLDPGFLVGDGTDVSINFVNTYTESGSFDITLDKLLTGKTWTDSDSFSFHIEPDSTALEDIRAGVLVPPAGWHDPDANGVYTVSVSYTGSGDVDSNGWTTEHLDLGSIEVGNLQTAGATYSFVIREDTSSFDYLNIYCKQPSIKLTLTASTKRGSDAQGLLGELEFVASYAYLDDGIEVGGSDPVSGISLPFVNRVYAAQKPVVPDNVSLRISKTLTGRDWGATDNYTVSIRVSENSDSLEQAQYLDYAAGGEYQDFGTTELLQHTYTMDDHDDWSVDFRFFSEGVYEFIVDEVQGSEFGVHYDKTVYTVTYTVTTDPAQEDRLVVARQITDADGNVKDAVSFANRYAPTGELTVSKTVAGNTGETDRAFTFVVTLDDGAFTGGSYITPNDGLVSFENGSVTFHLKAGETVTLDEIPDGAEYIVEELEADTEGYRTEWTDASDHGVIEAGMEAVAQCTNTRNSFVLPETGGIGAWVVIGISITLLFAGTVIVKSARSAKQEFPGFSRGSRGE